jgi:hypothetical protein
MKQILIGCCDECPYATFNYYNNNEGVDVMVGVCTLTNDNNIYFAREILDPSQIPDWCPLDNFMR